MSSNNLAIPQLTAGSAGKDVLVNDAVATIDGALTRTQTIDASVSSSPAFDTIKDAMRLLALNTADKVVITLPAVPHTWILANDADAANQATFSVGSTTVKVGAGQNIVAYCDGAGLVAASGGSSSGGGGGGSPLAKRRYARITASTSPIGNGSNGYIGLSSLTLAAVPGGPMPSCTVLGGTDGQNVARWFDNDPTTSFERGNASSDVVTTIDFIVAQAIVEVRALPIPSYSLEAPNTIKIEWSDDNVSFDPPITLSFTFPDNRTTQDEKTVTIAEYVEPGSGGGGATTLAALTDVDVSGATEGQVLTLTGGKWEGKTPAPSSGGGGGGGGGGSGDTYIVSRPKITNLILNHNVQMGSGWLPIAWDTVDLDEVGGAGSDLTKITAPAGVKRVRLTAYVQTIGDISSNFYLRFNRNGAVFMAAERTSVNESGLQLVSRWLPVTAGDTFVTEVNDQNNSAHIAGLADYGYGSPCFFQAEWDFGATADGGGGSSPAYPKVADFAGYDGDPNITTGSSGIFQATDDTDGLTLVMSGQSGGDRWKGLYRVIDTPANKWSLRVHALTDYNQNGYACAPLIVYRDGGTNAVVLGHNVAGNTAGVTMPRNGVGYNGNPHEGEKEQNYEWFRVDFDGSDTLTFYASRLGRAWQQLFTQGVNGTYGGLIDRFAVGIECNKGGDASAVSLKSLTFTR